MIMKILIVFSFLLSCVAFVFALATLLCGCSAGEVRDPPSAPPPACTICVGPRYIVNSHVECAGTEVPCESFASIVCATTADPSNCAWCIAHPPLNVDGLFASETFAGPAGSTCASVTTTGLCKASYYDGNITVTAVCGDGNANAQ
jgi:hypothetical protein